jgi:hypothetical protein
MPSSGMLRRVALVETDVSEERNVLRLLVTANVVPSSPILVTFNMQGECTIPGFTHVSEHRSVTVETDCALSRRKVRGHSRWRNPS